MNISILKRKAYRLTIAIILFLMVLSVGSPGCSRKESEKYTGPVEKVALAAYAGSYGFLPFIAQEQGYFAANGLEVTVNEYDFGLKAADALVAGNADIATAADFVLTSYSFDHGDLRALGTIATSTTDEIVFRKDRGIEKPIDLKGKRVGVPAKTKAEYFLARFLTFNGVAFRDIHVAYLEPSQIVEAISNGGIDAASVWEPFVQKIRASLGANAASWPAQSDQAFYYLLLGREGWVRKHPEAIKRFLKAMMQAEEFTGKYPAEARKFVARRFKYDMAFVQSIWQKNNFTVELPQALLLQMEDGARWRIKNRLTRKTKVPNYLNFIYIDGLKAVKPEAVTIIR